MWMGVSVSTLDEWISDAVDALGLADVWHSRDRDLVLELARDVAHGVARPAAPVTTYLLGLAVGRGGDAAELATQLARLAGERSAAE
jgi:hypothetical protein